MFLNKYSGSRFPFDTQHCTARFSSSNYGNHIMTLMSNHSISSVRRFLKKSFPKKNEIDDLPFQETSIQAYHISLEDDTLNELHDDKWNITYSLCGFVVKLQRKAKGYIYRHYFPCTLMVIISWISFIIPPSSIPGRISLLVTLFLVLTSYFGGIQVWYLNLLGILLHQLLGSAQFYVQIPLGFSSVRNTRIL